jgi:hypothetical protein
VVHLSKIGPKSLVATPSPISFGSSPTSSSKRAQRTSARQTGRSQQPKSPPIGERSLQLIQGSLSGRRVERQSPLLASLHRVSSGTLMGLGFSLVGLSALTLHWQNQWSKNFAELEATKVLEHRLHESAAVLEQHHIRTMGRPGQLLPTSSENLIHLPAPKQQGTKKATFPVLGGVAIGSSWPGKVRPSMPAGY